MMHRPPQAQRRRGATVVECAIVYPLTFLLTLGMMVLGVGVYRYNVVSYLARETARYASCHGHQYQAENAAAISAGTLPTVTESYLLNNIILPSSMGLDPNQLQLRQNVMIYFNSPPAPVGQGTQFWDDAGNLPNSRWPYVQDNTANPAHSTTCTVTVTISYNWIPEFWFSGPITLTSTSTMPMNY